LAAWPAGNRAYVYGGHFMRFIADRYGDDAHRAILDATAGSIWPTFFLFDHVAARWSQVLGTPVTPAQVALCLIDLKLARLAHDPAHLDSMVDIAGYAACLREVTR